MSALFHHLQSYTRQPPEATLLFADENLLSEVPHLQPHHNLHILSNRWDLASACRERGLQVEFCDFDCSHIADQSVARIVYRVSKEKPLVHHLINQSTRLLQPGGQLILAGEKSDGIKTYADKCAALFGSEGRARKKGRIYLAAIPLSGSAPARQSLDDGDYTRQRRVFDLNGSPVYSKPGQYGWDKIDPGSALLMEVARQQRDLGLQCRSLLDLGCGYGYLTLCTADWSDTETRYATDNNAAAVACMHRNAESFSMAVEISADDAGSSIARKFDLVLCNPPFHQGFTVDGSLTGKFLASTARRLEKHGTAMLVVNQFIGVEKAARGYFDQIRVLSSNGKFKVVALSRPRAG